MRGVFVCQAFVAPEWLLQLLKTVTAFYQWTQSSSVRVPWVGARDRCSYIIHVLRNFIVKFNQKNALNKIK
jgi:hypothetical protein